MINGRPNSTVKKENRGGHNTSFTEEEEKDLFEYIKNVFIDACLFFDDECLHFLAMNKWDKLHPNEINEFRASNGWIYHFKNKWRLSSFRARETKKVTFLDQEKLQDFLQNCNAINVLIPKTHIFNMDETFWRIINGNPIVIGLTGAENRKLIIDANSKIGFTAIFIISADGVFLKPIVIIKGKTPRCLIKTGQTNDNKLFRKFTNSGWIDINVMKFVLDQIHIQVRGEEALLILDEYSIHTDNIIKEYAQDLNIQLIFVPPGRTATNQPLNVSINGPIKSIGKKLLKQMFVIDPHAKPLISDAINSLITAKDLIKKETIIRSFMDACNL